MITLGHQCIVFVLRESVLRYMLCIHKPSRREFVEVDGSNKGVKAGGKRKAGDNLKASLSKRVWRKMSSSSIDVTFSKSVLGQRNVNRAFLKSVLGQGKDREGKVNQVKTAVVDK
jgi:hypothetical protein